MLRNAIATKRFVAATVILIKTIITDDIYTVIRTFIIPHIGYNHLISYRQIINITLTELAIHKVNSNKFKVHIHSYTCVNQWIH